MKNLIRVAIRHRTSPSLVVAGVVGLLLAPVSLAQIKVTPGDVEDSRRSDGFFNKLKVELKLTGQGLVGAKGIRVKVTKAVDDTGKDLINEKDPEKDFKEIDSPDSTEVKIPIELKNPERRAMSVQEISGFFDIFSPQRDPKSTLVVPSFQRNAGKPIADPALRSAGIEITLWTKAMFEARKKAEEEKLNKEMEEKAKKAEQSGKIEDALSVLAEGLAKVFGSMFSSFAEMGENDVAFYVKDPNSKLISIQFEDEKGAPVERGGRMSMGGDPRTIIFDFEKKPAATTRVKLYILTPRSIVSAPFKLASVTLP